MSLKPIPKGTAVVRTSKYRHLFGQLFQNSEWINSVAIGPCQTESNVLKANEKFYAWPWTTPGTVAVVPTSFKGALLGADQPLLVHDDTTVNDMAWHPFNQHLLATALQNGEVNLWSIPEEGLTTHLMKPTAVIPTGEKRLLSVDFHPVADNVLVAFDAGKQVRFFDLENSTEKFALPDVHKALPTNISWNLDGSLCATSAKDKTLRIFDPRANSVADSTEDHQGTKGGRVTWLRKKNLIFTNGFGKGSDRQIALYDPRKLGQRLTLQVIDTSSSSLLPFYDEDNSIMFLAGKGDGNIRYYEIVNEEPYIYYLSEFKAKDPQSGVSLLPRANDTTKNEIMRLAKITPNGHIMPIKFEVPRQDIHHFQEDLFPDTFDNKPSLSASEWFAGENKEPRMRSQKP